MGTSVNIPETDAAFYEKSRLVTNFVTTNNERLKVDITFLTQSIEPAQARWRTKYEAYLPAETRTLLITAEKNNAKTDYMPLFRQLVSGLLSNPNITDDDLSAMDLRRPDSTRTPSPVPATWPVVAQLDLNTPRTVTLNFVDSATRKKGKPRGVNGAVIRYALLETQPTDISELGTMVLDTQTPCPIEFGEAQRGKRLYYCLAWQNKRGQNGPWSPIEMAIVP